MADLLIQPTGQTMTQSRGRRPMHRSFRRRVRRVLKRKSLKLLAWCKLVLVNIAFGFMTQVVACRACLLKLWSCKEAGPSLKLPKPEQCPRPCLPSSLSLDLNALPEKHVLLRVTHALCAWAAQVDTVRRAGDHPEERLLGSEGRHLCATRRSSI